ncbi:hypothetical protein GWK47_018753 [Chionoecetes opilio]|uniref:Uncharacterized protein n=1 Tax=Chionoecetes opilio TaxID=41210 RepID=A0A8J4XSX9_CHIOP|nr:hypothetical protein GWK47_018753 [Chionoecetes opilio]
MGDGGSNSKEKDFEVLLENPLRRGTRECADHDPKPGGQRFPPPPTGARTSRKEGRRRPPSLLLRRRGNLSFGKKRPCFPRPQTRRAAASSSCASSPPRAPAQHFSVVSMKNREQLEERPAKGETGQKNIVFRLAATLDQTQADRSFPRHTCDEAALPRPERQRANKTPHPSAPTLKHRAAA